MLVLETPVRKIREEVARLQQAGEVEAADQAFISGAVAALLWLLDGTAKPSVLEFSRRGR